jgi:ABC-type amino acid transport substrate-binding protein
VCLLLLHPIYIAAEEYVIASQNIDYYPHYAFNSANKGLGWAILEAYAEYSGHTFHYVSMPVLRLQKELVKGNVDLIYPDHPTWTNPITRASQKTFSLPLTTSLVGTFVRPENLGKGIDSIKKVSIVLGFSPLYWQERIDANYVELITVNNSTQAMNLAVLNKTDAADGDYFVYQYLENSYRDLIPLVFDPTLPNTVVEYRLATVHRKELIKDIDDFIKGHKTLIDDLKQLYRIGDPYKIKQESNR